MTAEDAKKEFLKRAKNWAGEFLRIYVMWFSFPCIRIPMDIMEVF